MPKNSATERYQHLGPSELETIRRALTPRTMHYVIRNGLVDTWRVRYFMNIAARGARMQADPQEIEKAMLDWVRAPSRNSLEQAERDLVVAGMGYDESAKQSGLSADQLEEMHANLAYLGGQAEGLMYAPETYREIQVHGAARGMDNVYKNGIRLEFDLPENALKGRNASKLLDRIGDVQQWGLARFIGRPDFWDDLNQLGRGRLTRDELKGRWQGDGPPLPQPAPPPLGPPPDPQRNKRKPRRQESLDPSVGHRETRTVDRDEVAVWMDEEQTRPMIVNRYYTDGSVDILVSDGKGGLRTCRQERLPMSRGNPHQPMTLLRRFACVRVPQTGSSKRPPGPIRGD